LIKGGFSCANEPFDTVNLIKNNDVKHFLTEAKPNCNHANFKYQYEEPEFVDKNVPTTSYQTSNDSLFIYSLIPEIIANQYGRINSFLLMKNGSLICEEYFYGYTRNDLHQIESTTKSITSLLVGIAKDKGMISDIYEPLFKIFPEYKHLRTGDYRKINLANILSMTSGFSNEYEPYKDYNRIEYSLKRKLIAPIGEQFIYDGGNTEILGAVIKRKTGMYADIFAEKFLFEPLGIKKYDWSIFKQDSFPCMGGSLQMLPIDLIKIGTLIQHKGIYNNKQIITADWIIESTSTKTKTHIEGDDYGYQWWKIYIESNNKKYETIWANGIGSQFVYIVPKLDIIIATTGHNYQYDSWAISNGIGKYLYLLDN
jgi:CubicO group peptidase (beta-lactamase class C family)